MRKDAEGEATQVRFRGMAQSKQFVGLAARQPRAVLPEALPVAEGREVRDIVGPSGSVKTQARTDDTLGEPLSIRDVARILGCSVWTVRQKFLPRGLPCFRLGGTGTLRFFRNQVIHWILRQQQLSTSTISAGRR